MIVAVSSSAMTFFDPLPDKVLLKIVKMAVGRFTSLKNDEPRSTGTKDRIMRLVADSTIQGLAR